MPPVNHESPLAPLTARFRRVESISPIELTQMHALFSRFYENADLATFIKDLSEKSGVIMVREKNEAATIRGFSTIKQVELDDDGTARPSASSAATPSCTPTTGVTARSRTASFGTCWA